NQATQLRRRAKKQPGRSQAECAHGPHVADNLELGRLLNGQLGRTCALHDPSYIDASCGSAGASCGRAEPPAKICTMPAANPTSTPIFQASPYEPVASKMSPPPHAPKIGRAHV